MAAATISRAESKQRRWRALLEAIRAGRPFGADYLAVLGLAPLDTPALIDQIQHGLPYGAWQFFLEATGLPQELLARSAQFPLRTLSRRKDAGRLHADESDRLVRLARIFVHTLALFGADVAAARHWLTEPQLALAGAVPLAYAGTEVGARDVETLLGRLEHGIPS